MGITLSADTSAKAVSVALTDGKTLLAQYFQNTGLTHSRTLLVLVEDILRNNNLKISDIEKIAVAKGPGSFTGIRIGIAATQGIAFGSGIPLAGVSTLHAAACLCGDDGCVICPVMDARRGEVYNALFKYSEGETIRLCGDRAVKASDLALEAKNSATPYFLTGDGAVLCSQVFAEYNVSVKIAPELTRLQQAYGVALAALGETGNEREIEPNYLRVSQVEREYTMPQR